MRLGQGVAVVTGGASGLGFATARALVTAGQTVALVDRNAARLAEAVEELGPAATAISCDITCPEDVERTFQSVDMIGPIRVLVHCAGGGNAVRVLDVGGQPASREAFASIVELNLVGTFDVLRHAAARMALNETRDGDRGVCVLTSSIAGLEGQAAQVAYGAAKAGIVGMTLPAARDLSHHAIRVVTIVAGMFDTPMLAGLTPDTRHAMESAVPHPSRLGHADEFASTVAHVIENGFLNGTCIRLDGAIRLGSVETLWGEQLRRE